MELLNEKIRNDGFYSVGFNPLIEQYIMIVIICHWFWFERYYLINKEEYEWFDSAIQKLDDLAHDCYKQGVKHPRFYCSELECENTTEQVTNLRTLQTNSKPTE
ncbi:MAG: hypothetical protein ACLVCV_17025 [Phocaeicola vulgatus]|jgi:hypothetical protein